MLISIEGNIGSGKSTFFNELKTYFLKKYNSNSKKIYFLDEPVDVWESITNSDNKNILEEFYKDKSKYSFCFQVLAFSSRMQKLKEIIDSKKYDVIFMERSVYSDYNVFVRMLRKLKCMNDLEFKIYNNLFDTFTKQINYINLIYIDTSPEICLERITKRNRPGENISLEYLKDCYDMHEDWLASENKIITFNGNQDKSIYSQWIDIVKQLIMYSYEHVTEDGDSSPCFYNDEKITLKRKNNAFNNASERAEKLNKTS
jgi:deoxycitidine kinase/deoxyguanosine kinase